MAATAMTEYDLGPLTWVKTEIDHSLGQARENLEKLLASPAERAPVRYILTHLHQATGALAMVGLAAATRFNEELEKLVASMEAVDGEAIVHAVAAAKRGIGALSGYLDSLLAGQPDQPMGLLATYLALNRALGRSDASEGDLFFPNLATPLSPASAPAPLDEAVLSKALAHQRAQYQQSLLKVLKGGDTAEALRQMHAAVGAIESMQAASANRPFWAAAGAFLDALVFGGLELSPQTRALFPKLDQQIKLLIEGSDKVAERTFRDLLLAVARSRNVSDRIATLKAAYGLERLVAVPEAARGADDEVLVAMLRELRELTAQQKDTWLKYTSGNRAALEPFGKQAIVLAERSTRLQGRDVHAVLARLAEVAPQLKARAIPPSEALALEVATALLFLESALENYLRLGPDFPRQAATVAERLGSAMAGEPLPPMDAIEGGLLDEMTRRAQERLLVFQVGQEVLVNLQNIEQVLDGFFRDAARRPELSPLAAQFAQVQGALMIMELTDAAALNAAVMSRVQQFAEGSLDGAGEAAEMVADGLSALGLYMNALQQGSSAPRDALAPALLRFGLAQPAAIADKPATTTATVAPIDVEVGKQKVAALYEDWKEAPAEDTRVRLERAVDELQRDAAVVADADVARQSEVALQAIKQAASPDETGVFRAIQEIVPDKAPEAPAAQVVQLVDAPGAEVDRELLEIFLEEATEVVTAIGDSHAAAVAAPSDREALATIRRGFHTLKGSGRMVGLNELGEMAWQCEQVLNKWLKGDDAASAELLGFIEHARDRFTAWVGELKATGCARIDGALIQEQAERLKSEPPTPLADAPPTAAEATAAMEAAEPSQALEASAPVPDPFSFLGALAADEPAPAPGPDAPEEGTEAAGFETEAQGDAPAPSQREETQATPLPEPSEVVVGGVVLPTTFFAIYVAEAEEHCATLERELSRIESDPLAPVSEAFMRAAHTLASTSRTTGFEALADAAAALEKWLAEAIELPPEFDRERLAATRRAVDALVAMVQSVRGHAMPYPRDDVVAEMERLRVGLRESRRTGEGTHIRMPGRAEPAPATPAGIVEAAAEARPFEAGKDQRRMSDDVDRDLLPVFLDEAREIIPLVSEGVRRWKAAPADHSPARELQRQLHTLKGSARMTGLMRLGELAHILEERVNRLEQSPSPAPALFEELEERVDRFSANLERLARGEDIRDAEPIEVPVAAVFEHQKDKPSTLAVIAAAAQERTEREALPPELRESRSALLRVNADLIDRFVNDAGELSIARSRIELEMSAFRRALQDLTENIGRMRAQLREVEIAAEGQMQSTIKAREEIGETFDPLEFDRFSRMQELTRFLAESLGDVITLHQGLQKNLDETELAIHAQARLNRELQQGLMGVRLVPLGNLADRFYRIVRQTAKDLDKKANLELKGTRTELDRSVLEKITAPLEHLLRNAVAHGLESPDARARAGKPEIGEVSIEAAQRGNEVVLTIADDGAGLDFARIRARAVESGLLAADIELPEAQLAQFIFMAGFSTAEKVSQVSGRGVGLDVVRNEITSLGGRVEISSAPGRGTTFTVTLPLTLAVTQAVLMRAGSTVYAVPSVMIEQVQEYKAQAFAELGGRGEIEWKGNRYPLRSLLPMLGEVDTPVPARQIPVLLLKSGLLRAAIRVDEILGNREVVVKTIGPQLSRLAGIAGATVLGNGQVVLILNPVQLVHREQPAVEVKRAEPAREAPAQARSASALVMVVDDSLTVRKITSRMLSREGFEVATAKDGVDALQQLQDLRPDCILLDVEMPRMDGFEFARHVRADAATRAIPIVMITSRTADKHRNHALELGVNEYMGKPYQEEQLLELVRRYTRVAATA
ncbi:MAG TPA: Hpt domain-containing protein [Usitatibacter sp.]|nr:Hpt domain-containing protein [Usitatibacter sp.]